MKRWLPFVKRNPVVAVLRLSGVIASGNRPGGALNDATLAPLIERAFTKGKPDAVAIVVNSPGGSPAQSALISARIRRLAVEKEIPVYAFVEDVAASGGYYLASAADEIWIDDNSILGSIGVISSGFGFHDLIARHGIERRIYTAGRSKSMLDPFQPEKPEDIARLKQLQAQIHDGFIAHVKARRGERLNAESDLFAGDIWVGAHAVDVGLADGVGHLVPRMKAMFGDKVRFIQHGMRRSIFQRFGISLTDNIIGAIEERAHWARFGF